MKVLRRDPLGGEQEPDRLPIPPAQLGERPRGVGVIEDLPAAGRDGGRVGVLRDGDRPRSIRLQVAWETPARLAAYRMLQPRSRRRALIRSPTVMPRR
ncbi:hypothetical protein ODJ79_36575 [Actinoplanes sp. KI2]|nr:hypothetical protein [Actinoplanes sp. KI2]MCU7729262.1 hypothetical protein [Actinoplanes sp. KI2]